MFVFSFDCRNFHISYIIIVILCSTLFTQFKMTILYTNIQIFKWHIQLTLIILFVISLFITTEISAESILGCEDDRETKKFETRKINENDLVKDSLKTGTEIKDGKKKPLFLSEGGW